MIENMTMTVNHRFLTVFAAVALLSCGAMATLVRYPDYPAAIERDGAYDVSVRQGEKSERLVVWNHCEKSVLSERTRGGDVNRRFCEFAFDGGPVTVRIAVHQDVKAYKVFPARLGLKHSFADGVISVELDEPHHFGIQLNDYDKTILSVLVDAPEKSSDIPNRNDPGVMYVDGWLDAKEADGLYIVPKEIREIYIAPGAVLNSRLKVTHPGVRLHGRGMLLDPMSDIFRYDQSTNPARGLLSIATHGMTVEDVKFVDARTFNVICHGDKCHIRNVKILSSMTCSDGFTNGGKDAIIEDSWIYNGDNALVVSGVTDAVYSNIVIGTSCKAIFPQWNNRNVRMYNIDVFRADEGVIANEYNGVLRRNNKWHELGRELQHREPGPQELTPHIEEFFFDSLSAIDATYVGYVFRGRNMGDLHKTFVFSNLSVPLVMGWGGWRGIGKTNGVAVSVMNDPEKWLITHRYELIVTNLYLAGAPAANFPSFAVKPHDRKDLRLNVVTDPSLPRTVSLKADRTEVNWKCPADRRPAPPRPIENLLTDNKSVRSIWQRCPSWLVKFDACRRDEKGNVIYRLYQCEKNAGMQAIVTERVKASGFGKYHLSFEAKAKNDKPFGLDVMAIGNDKRTTVNIPDVDRSGEWKRYETDVDFSFDPNVADLASLMIAATGTAEEILFRDFSLRAKGK